jgi:superfamily II helicase
MADPIFSPDGKWMWTGSEWISAPPQSSSQSISIQDSAIVGDVVINDKEDIKEAYKAAMNETKSEEKRLQDLKDISILEHNGVSKTDYKSIIEKFVIMPWEKFTDRYVILEISLDKQLNLQIEKEEDKTEYIFWVCTPSKELTGMQFEGLERLNFSSLLEGGAYGPSVEVYRKHYNTINDKERVLNVMISDLCEVHDLMGFSNGIVSVYYWKK